MHNTITAHCNASLHPIITAHRSASAHTAHTSNRRNVCSLRTSKGQEDAQRTHSRMVWQALPIIEHANTIEHALYVLHAMLPLLPCLFLWSSTPLPFRPYLKWPRDPTTRPFLTYPCSLAAISGTSLMITSACLSTKLLNVGASCHINFSSGHGLGLE